MSRLLRVGEYVLNKFSLLYSVLGDKGPCVLYHAGVKVQYWMTHSTCIAKSQGKPFSWTANSIHSRVSSSAAGEMTRVSQ